MEMENMGQMNPQEIRIQGVLDKYLASRSSETPSASAIGGHIDDDSLAAFTEGNLNARESAPIVRHLIDCSFCRHITAELVRLDLEFAASDDIARPAVRNAEEPAKISEVLSGLLSKIFGTRDGAVFAHNEAEGEESEAAEAESEEKND